MTYAENLWLFSTLLFGIIIVPGMDMVFVMANALTGGRASGLTATAGIMAGGVFHTLYAALGVGFLLHLVPQLFNVLLLAGAAYIAWIGLSLARSHISIASRARGAAVALGQLPPGSTDKPPQPQGLSVHAGRLSAIPET